MDSIKKLKKCFKTFRKSEMKIWNDEYHSWEYVKDQ